MQGAAMVKLLQDQKMPAQERLLKLVFSEQISDHVIHGAVLASMMLHCDDVGPAPGLEAEEARIIAGCRSAMEDSLACLHQRPVRSEAQIVEAMERLLEDCRARLQVVRQFRELFSADAPLDQRWEALYRLAMLSCEVCRIPLRHMAPISPARNGLFALQVHLSDEERARLCRLICEEWKREVRAREALSQVLRRRATRSEEWLQRERERLEEGLF